MSTDEDWGTKLRYLLQSRFLYHNDDYLEFLVQRVWKLTRPVDVVDFGCGYGFLGLKLLPMLPAGSTYTGLDRSEILLAQGRQLFAAAGYAAQFVQADACQAPVPDDGFDVALCHALLMHLPQPEDAIAQMVRVTRPGGMVAAFEANRTAHAAAVHMAQFPDHPSIDVGLAQRYYRWQRQATGLDRNIGMRLPALLHQAGLTHVQARLCDRVNCYLPPSDDPQQERIYEALRDEGLGAPPDEKLAAEITQEYIAAGLSAAEAQAKVAELAARCQAFATAGSHHPVIVPGLLTVSWGTKPPLVKRS